MIYVALSVGERCASLVNNLITPWLSFPNIVYYRFMCWLNVTNVSWSNLLAYDSRTRTSFG